ncbi:MAG: ABC transporter permease [Spirochaetia bacterium]|jgi:ribose/xylose/arabinose/galactoside ABC-type transport system permease subunit
MTEIKAGLPKGTQAARGSIKSLVARMPAIAVSVIVMLVFLLVFYLIDHTLLVAMNIKTIIYIAMSMLAVGLGQSIPVITGGIDLSVGGIISLVSVVSILFLPPLGYWAFPVTLLVAAFCGLLNGILATTCKIPSFLLTLGTGGVFTSVTYLIHAAPMTFPQKCMKYAEAFNGGIGPVKFAWIWALLAFAVFLFIQKRTYLGRTIYAVGVNERMTWMSGINVNRTRLLSFVLSGIGAGIAGMIISTRLYSGSAIFGNSYVLESIACVVVGGIALTGGSGSAVNVLIGALTMGIIKNGLTIIGVDVMAQQMFLGILIILAVAVTFDRTKVTIVK